MKVKESCQFRTKQILLKRIWFLELTSIYWQIKQGVHKLIHIPMEQLQSDTCKIISELELSTSEVVKCLIIIEVDNIVI